MPSSLPLLPSHTPLNKHATCVVSCRGKCGQRPWLHEDHKKCWWAAGARLADRFFPARVYARTCLLTRRDAAGWLATLTHRPSALSVNKTGERLDGGVHKSTSIPSTIYLASNNQFSSDCVSQSLVRIIVLHQITGCLICKAVHRAPDYLRVTTSVPPLPEKKPRKLSDIRR